MTRSRLAIVALAAAMLIAAAPALAGNGGSTPVTDKTLQMEQLGPKYLLGGGSPRTRSTTPTPGTIPITSKNLLVEELGPKYLLGS
jgi:hypothetical protein